MAATLDLETLSTLDDESFTIALTKIQAEAEKRTARAQAHTALAESLATIRPQVEAYVEASGKTVAQVFTECAKIFKELPPAPAGVIAPEDQPRQWDGKTPADKGGIVIYNGEQYKSLADGNLYSPALAAGSWERMGVADA